MTVVEGSLAFRFSDGWHAAKYDELSFYVRHFQIICPDTKAVDIVAIRRKTLWLIEVKDYRHHRREKAISVDEEMARKVRDTLAGLWAAACNANDADERTFCASAVSCRTLRVVLHLEQPLKHSKLFPRLADPSLIQQRIRQRLRAVILIRASSAWGISGWSGRYHRTGTTPLRQGTEPRS